MAASRVFWLDFMRASAALMVILLHSGSPHLVVVDRPDRFQWAIIHGVEAAIQVCVPLFFMISGALLLNVSHRSPVKSIQRALVPLIFYTVLASIYLWSTKDVLILDTFKEAWSSKAFYHLWFFYPLVGIYACFYFLRASTDDPGKRALAVLIFMILLGGGTGLVARSYSVGSRIFVDGMFVGFLLYAFLGFYLRAWSEQSLNQPKTLTLIVALIGVWLVTMLLSRATNEVDIRYNGLFFTYQAPNMVVQSVLAFLVIKRAGTWMGRYSKLRKVTSYVATGSLGLFGIHAFVMDALRFQTPIGLRSEHALAHFIGLFLLTTAISLLVVSLLRRIDRKGMVV